MEQESHQDIREDVDRRREGVPEEMGRVYRWSSSCLAWYSVSSFFCCYMAQA